MDLAALTDRLWVAQHGAKTRKQVKREYKAKRRLAAREILDNVPFRHPIECGDLMAD